LTAPENYVKLLLMNTEDSDSCLYPPGS